MKSTFELFIKQNIEFKFVLFSIGQTLGGQHWCKYFMACSKLVNKAIYVVKQT